MSLQVLLIEDSPGDVRLTLEAFKVVDNDVEIRVAGDGVEAMALLRRDSKTPNMPPPDLILLDLNLPRMDGRQVLAQIKDDEELKRIPTVILTTSEAEADVLKSYQLKANAYLSKPVGFEAFESLVQSISDFWLIRAKLPHQETGG